LSPIDITALIEFLNTLEDSQLEMREHIIPASVPSGLIINTL
jgi:hypothetical protein